MAETTCDLETARPPGSPGRGILPVPHLALWAGKHGKTEEKARRPHRRLGAAGAPVRVGEAEEVREDQAPGALRRAGARAAAETSTSERTLYRRIAGFKEDDMRSLFGSPPAKRRMLPPRLCRLIVDRARPSAGRASGPQPERNRQYLLRPFAALLTILGLPRRLRLGHAGRVVLNGQVAVRGAADLISKCPAYSGNCDDGKSLP